MNKRVFIIHGWGGNPDEGWFPWLKKELLRGGVEVHVPTMPDPAHPSIDTWVPFLKQLIRLPDEHTYLIGHSIGAQAILRFLETMSVGTRVGGTILVAGWTTLKVEAMDDEEAGTVAAPWLDRPLNWPKIREHVDDVTAIMSDDDQFVAIENGKLFVRELGAKLIIEHQKRHLGGEDGITVLPSVPRELKRMMGM